MSNDSHDSALAPRSARRAGMSGKVLRWVVIPGVGIALGAWSVATMAGVYSMGTSLTTASKTLPSNLFAPASIALADPNGFHMARPVSAPALAGTDKSARFVQAAPLHKKPVPVIGAAPQGRFDSVQARVDLSPRNLAAAFARAGMAVADKQQPDQYQVASLDPQSAIAVADQTSPMGDAGITQGGAMQAEIPSDARFGVGLAADQDGPAADRFGPRTVEIDQSSNLALALVRSLPVEDQAFSSPLPITAPEGSVTLALGDIPAQDGLAEMNQQSDNSLPDNIDVPSFRPRVSAAPVTKVKTAPVKENAASARNTAVAARDDKPPRDSNPVARQTVNPNSRAGDMLAYARPDNPDESVGQSFKNLFSSTPKAQSGVAVYDISAQTVFMPNGDRLEAHSGLGAMVDQPRYVDQKNRGPTPPNTYDLRMRESRFHGVEALRLIPVNGKNKYNRDGLLAHTYMLRGGRAESNGCVVFKDYRRFLTAFKKGHVTRLVVVPGKGHSAGTRVASAARGA